MINITSEYTVLDKENQLAELSYSMNDKVLAKLIFDYKNDNTEVIGDLYNLIGWSDTPEDRSKYEKFIDLQKWFAKELLDKL